MHTARTTVSEQIHGTHALVINKTRPVKFPEESSPRIFPNHFSFKIKLKTEAPLDQLNITWPSIPCYLVILSTSLPVLPF